MKTKIIPCLTDRINKTEKYFRGYKETKKALILLIVLDVFLAIGSNINDFHILTKVEPWLIPFAPICSLYPLLLAIWFTLYYKKIKISNSFTTFIFIGIFSYGIMAQIYYPLFIYWDGFAWNLLGNMIWVALYALQAFIIASELRPVKWPVAIPIYGYFAFKDYADRFLGTFTDILYYDFPGYSLNLLMVIMLVLQFSAIMVARKIAKANAQ